jgi:hypothetical protein
MKWIKTEQEFTPQLSLEELDDLFEKTQMLATKVTFFCSDPDLKKQVDELSNKVAVYADDLEANHYHSIGAYR